MKKAILPAVISAALLATSAHAATVYDADGSTLKLTGEADAVLTAEKNADGVIGNDATAQLDWSTKLTDTITTMGSIELDLNDDGEFYADDVWVGVKTDFGTFKAGETGSSYALLEKAELANEAVDVDVLYSDAEGSGHAIRYQNTFGDLSVSANYDLADGNDTYAASVDYAIADFTIGAAHISNTAEGDKTKSTGTSISYDANGLSVAATYSIFDNQKAFEDINSSETKYNGSTIALSASYDIQDIAKIYGSYQIVDADEITTASSTSIDATATNTYVGVSRDITSDLTVFVEYNYLEVSGKDIADVNSYTTYAGVYYSF